MPKSSNGQITFAYLLNVGKQNGESGISLIEGYVPILAPLLHARRGQKFDPAELSFALRASYGATVHQYALEKLVPSLEGRGWLVRDFHERLSNVAAYRIADDISVEQPLALSEVESLIGVFAKFVAEQFSVHRLDIPGDDVIEREFVSRLQQLPAANVQALSRKSQDQEVKASGVGDKRATLSVPKDPAKQAEQIQEAQTAIRFNVLFGLFVKNLKESNQPTFDLLGRLASSALLSEVVLNYRTPDKPGDFKGVTFVLDCPLLMDLLDLDSIDRHLATTDLINGLKGAGATLKAFEHSVDEVRDNIKAALAAYKQRNGHGNIGLRMRQSAEFVARAEAIQIEVTRFVKDLGVTIAKAPSGKVTEQYFSVAAENNLYSAIGPYGNDLAQERDAASVAAVMRLRSGKTASRSDFGAARYYFLTRNPKLAVLSEDSLIAQHVQTRDDMPPCMTDRTLAALLWLVRGNSDAPAISQALLLANCAAIPASVDAVRETLAKLADAEHHYELTKTFNVWSRSTRGIEVLSRATLGDPSIVTKDNYQEIIDIVMKSAGEAAGELERQKVAGELAEKEESLAQLQEKLKAAEESIALVTAKSGGLEERVKEVEAHSAAKVSSLEERLLATEEAMRVERERQATQIHAEETRFLEKQISDCKVWEDGVYSAISKAFVVVSLAAGVFSIWIDKYSGWDVRYLAVALCALFLLGTGVQVARPHTFFGALVSSRKIRKFDQLLGQAHRGLLRDRVHIDERSGEIRMKDDSRIPRGAPVSTGINASQSAAN
ncbi:hypothetical protein [Cupriavidus sp. WS]|uniref:hypothetical protein n=1 Tax=Cupriavidus sp. WS TaxID=1312922 RepID=UPI00039C46A7|nr:hypothetical protein [Cupriavidus sp. WS]